MLKLISLLTAKSLALAIKLSKTGAGTNLPGRIARNIYPDLLKELVKHNKKEIITITGTNGKTTTAGLIASILRQDNRKVVHNQRGANMLNGITTAVAEQSSITGMLDSDNCVFEIDEAYLYKAVDEFSPDIITVTNLFRDQLDRYGELNTTAKKIESGIIKTFKNKPLKLVLNADDPIVSRIAVNSVAEKVFFGFDEIKLLNQDEKIQSPQESVNCQCGKSFSYSNIIYGHLGSFYCACGVKRPEPQIRAKAVVDVDSSVLYINDEFEVKVNLPGLYNCYNALCAVATALAAGIPVEIIKQGIENYSTIFGRAEAVEINGKKVLIQLIKNPIGATEVLRTLKNDENGRLFILINDNYADGRDVSWLWDANFELLSNYKKTAVVSGIRAADMAVRLKYAGINPENIIVEENIKKAYSLALNNTQTQERLYVLPTYTALLELDRIR